MIFKITHIEFDFTDELDPVTKEYKQELYDNVLGSHWEADDEDDLIEEITNGVGWCIKSIDYQHILNY